MGRTERLEKRVAELEAFIGNFDAEEFSKKLEAEVKKIVSSQQTPKTQPQDEKKPEVKKDGN